ncbi:MAG: hypothetical protein J3Q66DRAFT_438033 [Benniella sp.]|nr:MAG: hypothetical protein J3Q66DRAFT_438033 [Benniella sp.]
MTVTPLTMANNPDVQPTQTFRCRSTGDIANIPALIDPKSGNLIVLWRDIQSVFEDAKSVWNGKSLVPLVTDENLEQITPLRISYHAGVVLEVLVKEHSRPGTGESWSHNGHTTVDCDTLPRITASLTIAGSDRIDNSLVTYSPVMSEVFQSSHLLFNPRPDQSLQTIMSGQANIQQSIDRGFDLLRVQMDRNRELQEQLIQMQQLQQQTSDELLKKQDEIITMQKVTIDRLAIIQSRVQAVLTQTYELHEYPIPRLFIVLPKNTGFCDKLTHPFSHQFRLYFLCECGSHTMTKNTKIRHEIHLAKHEGYDLEKPTEFFERYGSYVLTLMHMIKYGITVAGLVVPPLANSGVVSGIDSAQKHMDYIKKNIAPLVDDTIKFLNGIKRNNEFGEELSVDHTDRTELDQVEALEGADLRQLESYLKVKDQGRILGNLYRIVTLEGHVKWVCFDHYRDTYLESLIQHLRDIVVLNNGTYIEEIGRIEITVTSHTLAKEFYQALIKARGIQELDITLGWDATTDEIQSFANAVTKANVFDLTVNGTFFKSPALDVINRGHRFDPILQLASNARIHSLQLDGFEDFFSRISKSAMSPAPRLRTFSMNSGLPFKDKTLRSLGDFLGYCSALTTLQLRLHSQYPIEETISNILNKLRNLDSLKIDRENLGLTASVSEAKIQDVTLSIKWFYDLSSEDLAFIQHGHFTRLRIECTHAVGSDRLEDALRNSSVRNHIRIKHQESCLAIATNMELMIQELMKMAVSEAPSVPDSIALGCRRLFLTSNYTRNGIHDMAITITQLADLTDGDLTFIKENRFTQLVIELVSMQPGEDRLIDILRHGAELSHVRIECKEERCRITARKPLLKIQDLVRIVTSEAQGKLESLLIDSGRSSTSVRLSRGRIHEMVMTIAQLGDISPDDLKFIQQGHLTQLVIEQIPLKSDKTRLGDILRHCQKLTHLQIGSNGERNNTIRTEIKLQDLAQMATSDILGKLESLKADWGELSFAASVSNGKIQDVDLTIGRINDLSSKDLDFIQKEHLTRLAIMFTPSKEDDNQLIDVLRSYPRLSHLQIGCKPVRCLAIVNLVISTREKILQEAGSCCLHAFELMQEKLVPFHKFGQRMQVSRIQSRLSFTDNSTAFDMHTWVKVRSKDKGPVIDFVSQYAWSIVTYDELLYFSSNLNLPGKCVSGARGSQLEHLRLFHSQPFQSLQWIIEGSSRLMEFGLYEPVGTYEAQIQRAFRNLHQYGATLNMLYLFGPSISQWLPRIASAFPTRNSFPRLMTFCLSSGTFLSTIPADCVSWIVAMVSASSHDPTTSLSKDIPDDLRADNELRAPRPWTLLRKITLNSVRLQHEEWVSVIMALDFSELESLWLGHSNITQEHLTLLVDRIPNDAVFKVPLKDLRIHGTSVAKNVKSRTLLEELRKKVPSIEITE